MIQPSLHETETCSKKFHTEQEFLATLLAVTFIINNIQQKLLQK